MRIMRYFALYPLVGLALLLASGLSVARAQNLAELAPPDSIITLGLERDTRLDSSDLQAAFEALDIDRARATFEQIAFLAADAGDIILDELPADLSFLLQDLLFMFEDTDEDAFAEFCPALSERFADDGEALLELFLGEQALLTVSFSPFNFFPAVTALVRLAEEDVDDAVAVREALLACLEDAGESIETLEESGVTMYLLGDGSELPLLIGNSDAVFFIGSNPDVLRRVIRRQQGEDSASLADTRLYQASRRHFHSTGAYFSIDFQAIESVVQGFRNQIVFDNESALLFERGTALLRTLGGAATQASKVTDGIRFESLLAVDNDGGDPELARLLRCPDCQLNDPLFAPADSVVVATEVIQWQAGFEYLQGWLDALATATGDDEDMDIKVLLREELGFDLDVALFDWIGDQWFFVQLEPLSQDLATLIYSPQQALAFSIRDPAAAQAGLEAWADLVAQLMDEFADEMAEDAFALSTAEDSLEYGGVAIERYRFGPNLDISLFFLDDLMVLASPLAAAQRIIDTHNGDNNNILVNDSYFEATRRRPRNFSSFVFSDDQSQVASLASLLELFSQPLAFLWDVGLQAAFLSEGDEVFPAFSMGMEMGYFVDLTGAEATPLEVPGQVSATLDETLLFNNNIISYYALQGLNPGDRVSVQVTSQDFDTYLYLVDIDNQRYIDENDDFPPGDITQSRLEFTVQEGITYWIGVSSFGRTEIGDYTLSAEVASSDDTLQGISAEDLPSFPDLLHLSEFTSNALYMLSERLSSSDGYSGENNSGIYSRVLLRLRW